jgi:hypothetical protein
MQGTKRFYDSYKMFHMDGTLMCSTTKDKALWYINRGLAEWMDDDQQSYRLLFVPNGKGKHDDDYYLQNFQNQCVCCGSKDLLTRHHVVPSAFRRYFPVENKAHSFHDVLFVCGECHETYERVGDRYREELCERYLGRPFNELQNEANQSRSAIKAHLTLERYGHLIPPERRERLQQFASYKDTMEIKYFDWAKRVVEKLDTPEKLHEFVILWRKHFLEVMSPKFMPENWSVERKLDIADVR